MGIMGMVSTSVDVTTYSISFAVEGRCRRCVDFFAADDDSSSSVVIIMAVRRFSHHQMDINEEGCPER